VFPIIPDYDAADLGEVEGMARKLKMVSFAAQHKGKGALSGLYIDGTNITACNGNQLARVACKVPVLEPVVLPIAPLGGVLKNTDTVLMGYLDGRFVFQTDAETQITSTVITDKYPDVERFVELRKIHDDAKVTFSTNVMAGVLERMLALCGDEEYPRVRMRFQPDAIQLGMHVEAVGQITDEIPMVEYSSEPPGDAKTYVMMPQYLLQVLSAWQKSDFPLEYCSTDVLKPYAVGNDEFISMWMGVRE
jgi:DNA polymerase III sliding clamp (beta) subunit (PCNA family)